MRCCWPEISCWTTRYQTPTMATPATRGDAQAGEERDLLALAPLLPVREQVDHDHCTNLRIARPHAVRYDGASRRSLASRTARAELHVLERVDDHRREAGELGDAVLEARQRRGAAGEHHVVDLVVRRAGEEVLQRAADFLRQAVDEGREQRGLVVVGQVGGELLLLGFLVREAVLARDQLGELRAAEGLVAVVEHLVVAQHLQAGRVGADLEQRDQRVAALVGQARRRRGSSPGARHATRCRAPRA